MIRRKTCHVLTGKLRLRPSRWFFRQNYVLQVELEDDGWHSPDMRRKYGGWMDATFHDLQELGIIGRITKKLLGENDE